jgi:hypothetical protein
MKITRPFHEDEIYKPISSGHVYYAIQTTEAFYTDFYHDMAEVYTDGTHSIYNTIQEAIDACTANRGDIVYVIGEWTSAVTITLNKWGTSLIGLTDWNNQTGGGNANITCTGEGIATLTVTKAKCHVENLVIYFNGDGATFGINFASSAPSQAVVRNVEIVKNAGTAADAGIGMHFATVPTRALFENIKITGPTSNSKTMAYGIEGGSYSCVFKNIQVSNATVGINLDTYGDLFDHIIIMPTCTTGLVLTGTSATQSLVVNSYDAAVSAGSITAATSGSYSTSLTTLT